MKAKELYEKYKLDILLNGEKHAKNILIDLINETIEIKEKRNIKKIESFQSIINEQQQKLDCLNVLFKKKHGVNIFVDKAFENYFKNVYKANLKEMETKNDI